MQLGIHLPHIGRKASPDAIRRAADAGRGPGLRRCLGQRAHHRAEGRRLPALALFYDPVLTLTWAAAFTKRVRLGTSVLVLPMRHPLPLAKELATLQNLSEGRLILGAGVGWMEAGVRRPRRAVPRTRPAHGRRHRDDARGVDPGPGHLPDTHGSRR